MHLADVIHPLGNPVSVAGATAVLTGNLAPRGCVMKPSAADPRFLRHRGPVLAFENYDHMAREIERDDLAVTPDHILVLKNGGPKGGPGMPEWGMLPIPRKLVKAGVRDMVRISDARMSGTSYGACILHVAPESFVGGPLALVETGDEIEVDAEARRIHLHVSDEELARRRAAWRPPAPRYPRGYGAMYSAHIGQADEGCDFDFLEGTAAGRRAGDPLKIYLLRRVGQGSARKLARSAGESPAQVRRSEPPGSECCASRRQRRPRSVHSGCVGCVIEPRNDLIAGAEAVLCVERNMSNAVMRGIAAPPGSKSTSRAKGSRRNLGDPASGRRLSDAGGPHREGEEP